MNAIVLAGGFGSRLMPLTKDTPKPMLKIANRPVLDYVVAQLYAYGLSDIVFTLGYLPEKIENFVVSYRGITPKFSVESVPLGTAGGVKKAEDMLDELFVAVSGDALSNIDLGQMTAEHLRSGADVTLAAVKVADPGRYGVVTLAGDGKTVTGFTEKPGYGASGSLVNAGVYVISKRVLGYIPRGINFDFARDLFPQLVEARTLKAYRHDGYWCDIGDKASYYRANFFMREGGFYTPVPSFAEAEMSSVERGGNLLATGAVTVGGCRGSIVGKGARIVSGADVNECVILDGATVTGKHSRCIIGADFVEEIGENLPAGAKTEEYSLKIPLGGL